jgi:hypothetical protein
MDRFVKRNKNFGRAGRLRAISGRVKRGSEHAGSKFAHEVPLPTREGLGIRRGQVVKATIVSGKGKKVIAMSTEGNEVEGTVVFEQEVHYNEPSFSFNKSH